jgi:hypothetical protein
VPRYPRRYGSAKNNPFLGTQLIVAGYSAVAKSPRASLTAEPTERYAIRVFIDKPAHLDALHTRRLSNP